MKYSVMTKKNVDDQNKWTFDYFTQEALKKKPRSGIVFRKIPSTRGFVTKCVKYWAGHADDPTPIWKERCWDTYEPDNPNIPDPGTGGCRHCCEEAYSDPDGGGGGGGSGSYTPPVKELPKFSNLSSNFLNVAKLTAEDVCKLIGGKVLQNYQNTPEFKNACAIRLSYAFNKIAGHKIPYTNNKTVSGSDNNWYIYRVTDMVNYLKDNYGNPISTTTDKIRGRHGIIWQSECGWGDASGHLDVWDNNNSLNHFYNECQDVYFWEIN